MLRNLVIGLVAAIVFVCVLLWLVLRKDKPVDAPIGSGELYPGQPDPNAPPGASNKPPSAP